MLKKLAIGAVALMFLAPMLGLVTVGLVMNPAANAACSISSISVRNVPSSLTVTSADGHSFTLNKQQLTHAATIITVGSRIDGVARNALKIALMAALTESTLRMLANTGTYPESGSYPNDGNGSDHDSLGLFQMRPQSGWGTVAELMDPKYQAAAFFGGLTGPNYPSPRGLLDIPGWQSMGLGEVAQAVEVSAYPDRYDNYAPVAETILGALTAASAPASTPISGGDSDAVSTSVSAGKSVGIAPTAHSSARVVFPLPESTWVQTDHFGPRVDPISGEQSTHHGLDLAAPDGTPILAAANGVVTVAEFSANWGGLIVIEHQLDGGTVATAYAHMWRHGIHVTPGEAVIAGQHIGDVGSSGYSTGPHLHFEVRPGGTNNAASDPAAWLNSHNAADLPEATAGATGCKI